MNRTLGLYMFILLWALSVGAQSKVDDSEIQQREEALAAGKRLHDLLQKPDFITLRLTYGYVYEKPVENSTPYRVGDSMYFQLLVSQSVFDDLTVESTRWSHYEYRPELSRDGEVIAYRKEAQEAVEHADQDRASSVSHIPIRLVPGREYNWATVKLDDWYDPLGPGHYQLTVSKRFVWDGDRVQSNPVIFDVEPRQPQPRSDSAEDRLALERLDEKVSGHLELKLPGWKHKHGEPMLGSKNVIEDFWSVANRVVKVSILPHESAKEARSVLREFVKYNSEKEELKGLGDEAYAWGYALSNIAFREGAFTFYVSTTAKVDQDADARLLPAAKRDERERLEMRRLSREFAQHVVDAIDAP
jgi:hypothetical protein